jgi:hypothetical protein
VNNKFDSGQNLKATPETADSDRQKLEVIVKCAATVFVFPAAEIGQNLSEQKVYSFLKIAAKIERRDDPIILLLHGHEEQDVKVITQYLTKLQDATKMIPFSCVITIPENCNELHMERSLNMILGCLEKNVFPPKDKEKEKELIITTKFTPIFRSNKIEGYFEVNILSAKFNAKGLYKMKHGISQTIDSKFVGNTGKSKLFKGTETIFTEAEGKRIFVISANDDSLNQDNEDIKKVYTVRFFVEGVFGFSPSGYVEIPMNSILKGNTFFEESEISLKPQKKEKVVGRVLVRLIFY